MIGRPVQLLACRLESIMMKLSKSRRRVDTQSFEFVSDVAIRKVLGDYYGQARKASEAGSTLALLSAVVRLSKGY